MIEFKKKLVSFAGKPARTCVEQITKKRHRQFDLD